MKDSTRGLLINLSEEASEVSQIVAKCLRFGMLSYDPANPEEKNFTLLGKEIGNFLEVVDQLRDVYPLFDTYILSGKEKKKRSLRKFPLIIPEGNEARKDGTF